jgi:ubiquinone/menaquinone biosynthesis C-methylase UbiE
MIETTREEDPRRALVAAVPGLVGRLTRGIDVLSLGCGRGDRLRGLALEFPRSRFVGLDGSVFDIQRARRRVRREGPSGIRFEARAPAALCSWSEFDLAFACSIHDEPDVARVVVGIHRALRFGGVFLMPALESRDVEVLRATGFADVTEIQAERWPDIRCHVATK